MSQTDDMIYNLRYKKFDTTDTTKNGNVLKSYPEDEELIKDEAGMSRTFETIIGGTLNLYVKVYSSGVASTSSVKANYKISVYDKYNNVIKSKSITTTGKGSANITLSLLIMPLGAYTIKVERENHSFGAQVSEMVLYGKIVDNTNLYIF